MHEFLAKFFEIKSVRALNVQSHLAPVKIRIGAKESVYSQLKLVLPPILPPVYH